MDLPSLNALIRVNGLTKESAPQNIADVLLRSGYKENEIPQAIAVIQGAPPPPEISVPAAYVQSIITGTRTVTHIDGHASIFAGRLGVRQFWFGTLLSVILYGLVFILVEVSAVPIFSIISGISLFAPPDLATAPVHVLLLFGLGAAMLILPALFFLVVTMGLQVRRCHDYGLSGLSWFMAVAALIVCGYLLWHLTPLTVLAAAFAFLLWLILVSWPGTNEENEHGDPVVYPSVWGALGGSFDDAGCLKGFAKRFLLPLAYLQIGGIVLCICIHSILPRVHIPSPVFHPIAIPNSANAVQI